MSLESYRNALEEQKRREHGYKKPNNYPNGGSSQYPDSAANQQPYYQPYQYGQYQPQQVIIMEKRSNGWGITGFVLAIVGIVVSLIDLVITFVMPFSAIVTGPFILFFILGLSGLGLLFSFIGLFKTPKGLSIAAFILNFIGFSIAITGLVLGTAAVVGLVGAMS